MSIFNKGAKIILFYKMLEQLDIHIRNDELDPYLTLFEVIMVINIKTKTIN